MIRKLRLLSAIQVVLSPMLKRAIGTSEWRADDCAVLVVDARVL